MSNLISNMWAQKLTLEEAKEIYAVYVHADFPPDEIKPFAVIEKMWEKQGYFAYGFYEETSGEEDKGCGQHGEKQLCAYAFLLANNKQHVLLLDYFAVCSPKRGEGYGSRALPLLQEECSNWDALVIEVEDDELPTISETVREARKRRISFYTHGGCIMTDTRSRVWGVDYRLMALPIRDSHVGRDMAQKVTALYRGMYSDEAMEKHFKITAV